MAKKTKKRFKSNLKLEALEQRQLLAGITGSGTELTPGGSGADKFIVASNGNHYDQVLLTGTSVSVTNDTGNITRVSFLDLQGDIVQAEFGGAGTLTISLDPSTAVAGVQPTKYNQTVTGGYEQGLASFTVTGSDATTNLTVFSVGSGTAFAGNTLFDATHTGGDHTADVAKITIVANPANPNGSIFGGIRAGNAVFSADSGVVGIAAANVQVQDVVTIGDIKTSATSTATPTLVFGTASQFGSVTVAGGGLSEANGKSINNAGSYNFGLNFTAGSDSTVAPGGTANLPAQTPAAGLSFTGNNPIAAQVKTFTLTTGVDAITGTAGNDIINGAIGNVGGATATLTALDNIDGGAGTGDQLSINDVGTSGPPNAGTPLPNGLTIKNVETINFAAAYDANIDTSTTNITGLTALNVITSTGADNIKAGAGQAVTAFDTAGKVTLAGGSTQTVTTAGGYALSGATGAITVTDTAQAAVASTIDDGTTVNLTASAKNNGGTTGTITIGNTTKPTGAVTVSSTLVGDSTYATNTTGGTITVKGGTTDSVTQAVTNPVNTVAGANAIVTEAAVNVTGSTSTTSVTVNQVAASTAAPTVLAVSAVTEVATVQFTGTPAAGDTIVLDGLKYTVPATGATAKQVAAAFANLANGLGTFSTGAVSGANSDTVTFTGLSAKALTDLANSGLLADGVTPSTGLTTINTITQGVTSAKASGAAGVIPGSVTISDANVSATTNTISSVTLSNYGASTITSNALNTLSLSNSSGATSALLTLNNTVATSLDLTVNASKGINTINDASNTYTTLKVHTTGNDTTLAGFTDTSLKSLTVDGTKKLTITTAPASLTSVTVSGSAGLKMTAGANVTDVNASGTSGAVTVTLDPTLATYEGGSGADNVTIAVAPTKAISGGAGTDTLTLTSTALTNPSTNTNISGFETLALTGAAGGGSFDATGFTGVSADAITGGAVTFSNVAAGSPLSIVVPGQDVTYQLKTDTAADALTINVNGDASGTTTKAAGIESITIANSSNDSQIKLAADSVTSITVTGSKALNLINSGNVVLASVDASAATGALTHTTNGTVAETVKGGSAADKLIAGGTTTADVLIGGAGADTLTSNAGLTTLTGGSGNDTFVVATKTANVNVYTTVTDASAGDLLQLAAAGGTGVESFAPTKLVLGSGTAVFQDYANAVVNTGGAASANGYVGWFQFNGDTYVVEAMHTGTSFDSTQDIVVKLSGLVDLSGAAFAQNAGVPELIIR